MEQFTGLDPFTVAQNPAPKYNPLTGRLTVWLFSKDAEGNWEQDRKHQERKRTKVKIPVVVAPPWWIA